MPAPRIMYIENKSGQTPSSHGVQGPAVIGRVTFSKTGRTLYYNGRQLMKVKGGDKYNHVDAETGECYWVSGPKKNGEDGLYGARATPIDEDAREEYWVLIRQLPDKRDSKTT